MGPKTNNPWELFLYIKKHCTIKLTVIQLIEIYHYNFKEGLMSRKLKIHLYKNSREDNYVTKSTSNIYLKAKLGNNQ